MDLYKEMKGDKNVKISKHIRFLDLNFFKTELMN